MRIRSFLAFVISICITFAFVPVKTFAFSERGNAQFTDVVNTGKANDCPTIDSSLNGTISIAEAISNNTYKSTLISVLGGGDTLAAINKSKKKLCFSHLSTAGGAFLEYLEGKDLPGLSVLK